MTTPISQTTYDFFWGTLVLPRLGDAYVWGGSFAGPDVKQGTDCSGAVSAELSALQNGADMIYERQFWTGTFAGITPGQVGPFAGINDTEGLVCIATPTDAPADAAMIIAVRQETDPMDAHMICSVGGVTIEMGGDSNNFHTSQTDPTCSSIYDTTEFNQWFYLPGGPGKGPGGTVTPPPTEPPDTIYADVSEFQAAMTDAYTSATYSDNGTWPFQWIAIRSNDGDHVDENFATNYQCCVAACAAGLITGFMVYYYWRPDGSGVTNHIQLVNAEGGPHPQMVSMMDVESGDGNGSSDQSGELNSEFGVLTAWLGANPLRVVGYGNVSDLNNIWGTKPLGLKLVIASYGANPGYPGQIAHQYTNGQGYGGGLPEGAPPFGNCDMNSADGFSPTQLAAALGLGVPVMPTPTPTPTPVPVPVPTPTPAPVQPLTDAQMQDLFNMVSIIFQQVAGVVPGLPLLPGSPTPMPATWPVSLKTVLGGTS